MLPQAAKDEVAAFFLSDATRESADVKNVRRQCIARGEWVSHATRWREASEYKVSYSSFYREMPYFVQKVTQRYTCMCPQCSVIWNMLEAQPGRLRLQRG